MNGKCNLIEKVRKAISGLVDKIKGVYKNTVTRAKIFELKVKATYKIIATNISGLWR